MLSGCSPETKTHRKEGLPSCADHPAHSSLLPPPLRVGWQMRGVSGVDARGNIPVFESRRSPDPPQPCATARRKRRAGDLTKLTARPATAKRIAQRTPPSSLPPSSLGGAGPGGRRRRPQIRASPETHPAFAGNLPKGWNQGSGTPRELLPHSSPLAPSLRQSIDWRGTQY